MAQKGHIVNTQFIVEFQRNVQIRKRVFELEEKLAGHFKPFQVNNIPDEMDSSIVRMETSSINGYSQLKISQNRLNLLTSYNENYKKDTALVKDYLSERKDLLIEAIKNEKILFAAYIVELVIHMQESEINTFIKSNSQAAPVDNDTIDFSILYSKKYRDQFYLNVTCSKITEQDLILKNNTLVPSGILKQGVNAILDINSRPSIPKDTEEFDENIFNNIEELLFKLIEQKTFEDYLKGQL